MDIPSSQSFSKATLKSADLAQRAFLDRAEFAREQIASFMLSWVAERPRGMRFERLLHSLSGAWESRSPGTPNSCTRYYDELKAFRAITPDCLKSIYQSDGLENVLLQISSAVGGPVSFRTTGIKTESDNFGGTVVYPPVGDIFPQLNRLSEFLSSHGEENALVVATIAFNVINNIHPFVDCNGRISRVLFNLLINRRLKEGCYLPLYELSSLSKGGYLIRMRDAQYNNNWDPLINYHAYAMVDFWTDWAALRD